MKLPSVYSIDAGLPFAEQVVRGLMAIADTPEQLARALVLVPSRRSGQACRAAFLSVSDGQAMLLPRMVPIGDIGDEVNQGDPLGALLDARLQICRQPLAPCGASFCWQNYCGISVSAIITHPPTGHVACQFSGPAS